MTTSTHYRVVRRPAMHLCPTCLYPHPSEHCLNPCCEANPTLSEEWKAELRQRADGRARAEAERAKLLRIRAQCR